MLGCIGQNTSHLQAPWKLTNYSGEISMNGTYRQLRWTTASLENKTDYSALLGSISLNSNSYVWHPNFLQLRTRLVYSPKKYTETNLLFLDQSEVNTTKEIGLEADIFQGKKVSFNSFVKWSETYQNREYISDVKTNSLSFGGGGKINNQYFPLIFDLKKNKSINTLLSTGRTFSNDGKSLNARVSKSFYTLDKHKLNYRYRDILIERNYGNIDNTDIITNKRHTLRLDNETFFNARKKAKFKSRLSFDDQKSTYLNYQTFSAHEGVSFSLPYNFTSTTGYFYSNSGQDSIKSLQNKIETRLSHQLYLSLKTDVFFEHNNFTYPKSDRKINKTGLNLNYTKKIPAHGRLDISYRYFLQNTNMNAESVSLAIFDEEHTLSVGQPETLDKPFAKINSVLVKSTTGGIIYQLNFDYSLVQIGNYVEVRRIPGGQISDGQTVLIDYQVTQPGTYDLILNNHNFNAKISLFNNFISIYYRRNQQDYGGGDHADLLNLPYITENITGAKVDFKLAEVGIEYTNHQSTIIPYRTMNYNAAFNYTFFSKLKFSIYGNLLDYTILTNNLHQTYLDVAVKLAYTINHKQKISLDLGHQNHQGDLINFNLLRSRLDYSMNFRQLNFGLGLEVYKKTRDNQEFNVNAVYFRVSRFFN